MILFQELACSTLLRHIQAWAFAWILPMPNESAVELQAVLLVSAFSSTLAEVAHYQMQYERALEATSVATSLYRALGFERLFGDQTFARGPVVQA
ncbi:hypothetical protein [Pseudomonas trivialis]|uniref:Uncharacterized protein n=1 Tax=Pseudomonas trivialis TaxID=200450 RepID=A0A0R2ZJQ9_9PSED|nr:hypothetical protein [Pseudomonas trivialis]KRP60954.1 hypothetical protein TU79_10320 [Pseudomonas trivialis]SDS52263.1 hypothetical protein SAMN04490205_2752 [Pseudomonas trivialis]